MTETKRSAFYGKYCTHKVAREDAVYHNGREYVPTIWGRETGNTVHSSNMQEFLRNGGTILHNEDQTEITLVLPVGHKFGCKFFENEIADYRAATAAAAGQEPEDWVKHNLEMRKPKPQRVTRAQVLDSLVATAPMPWENMREDIDSKLPMWMTMVAARFFEEGREDEHARVIRQGLTQLNKEGSIA